MTGQHETTATAVIDNGRFGKRHVTFETGRLARQAAGSTVASLDDVVHRLGGHVQWRELEALRGRMRRVGVGFSLLDSERIAAVPPDQLRALLVGALAGDYTSFHLGLVVNACAKAGFFALFVRTRRIAAPIAWWGLIASLYVAIAIVGRDFIAALGRDAVTVGFMVGNLVAHVALGLYLVTRGVRPG